MWKLVSLVCISAVTQHYVHFHCFLSYIQRIVKDAIVIYQTPNPETSSNCFSSLTVANAYGSVYNDMKPAQL